MIRRRGARSSLYRERRSRSARSSCCCSRYIEEHGFGGFWHPGLGQEGLQAGAVSALRRDDYLFYAHRGLGYALAKGMSPVTLLGDLFGRVGGSVGGKGGGTVHFVDPELGVLGQGGTSAPASCSAPGAGISAQMLGTDRVVGDLLRRRRRRPRHLPRGGADRPRSGSCRWSGSARTTAGRSRCRSPSRARPRTSPTAPPPTACPASSSTARTRWRSARRPRRRSRAPAPARARR